MKTKTVKTTEYVYDDAGRIEKTIETNYSEEIAE
jgi:hypothetical protein